MGVLVTILLSLFCTLNVAHAQLELCQLNCVSDDRLTGPTKMQNTRPHPFKIAPFPTKLDQFCKLGCQLFFSEKPNNVTCKDSCDFSYRYRATDGYIDVAEEAILECRDGCDIALQVCQEGFYCRDGSMISCPSGTYRTAVASVSIEDLDQASACTNCPPGRYRSRDQGTSIESCTKCPIGKYANVTGSILVSDCLRCPAGKTAEDKGMELCKCITEDSCDLPRTVFGEDTVHFFENGIDFFRETTPYKGRS